MGYSYNPFSRELINMNIIRYLSKNDNGLSIDDLKKEDFITNKKIRFFVKKELCCINITYQDTWLKGSYGFQDSETQNYWIIQRKTIQWIK